MLTKKEPRKVTASASTTRCCGECQAKMPAFECDECGVGLCADHVYFSDDHWLWRDCDGILAHRCKACLREATDKALAGGNLKSVDPDLSKAICTVFKAIADADDWSDDDVVALADEGRAAL